MPAAVEVTPLSHPDTVRRLTERGYAHDPGADVTVLARALEEAIPPAPTHVVVRPVTSATLTDWAALTALGWGHATHEARRAADAFARAAFEVDGDGMVIAFDAGDGRPLGCASMTLRDGVATLGGMSTIPAERRRGVQGALILHRLQLARARGCDLAATTTQTGGASERNVIRHGFGALCVIQTWTIPPGAITAAPPDPALRTRAPGEQAQPIPPRRPRGRPRIP